MNAFDILGSGLTANKQIMDITANNITNMNTTRSAEGGPYKRQSVILQSKPGFDEYFNKNVGGGVELKKIVQDNTYKVVYDPTNPDADAEGNVKYPNINLPAEMTNMMVAQRAYESNITVLNAEKNITNKTLEIGKV